MVENEIYMVHEKLEKIPMIPGCTTAIDLRRNNISEMSMNRAEAVEYLDLSDNRISTINNLENMPNLKVLDLSYNLITDICIPRMNIEELYLISNDITEISGLDLPRIKKLDIAVNNISRIENLERCCTLEELYLGGNRIKTVEGLESLAMLKVLDLQNNGLEIVDCEMIPKSIEILLLGENRKLEAIRNIEMLKSLRILGIERTDIPRDTIRGNFDVWY